ncbi:glycoside hydrolase family 3 N-terminal domain-containing protein [Brevibacterium ihuae]|uniref:glycoside hydrolase family 3 N-terminal domain-containing protein n=1 Tax=Brevibacterium ihuae TaxID=1631743 RepID=UPI000C78791A|nr:glycoside hydrolase family 3 N-terminal domain-containing protein [Brevibacterium ihuae]
MRMPVLAAAAVLALSGCTMSGPVGTSDGPAGSSSATAPTPGEDAPERIAPVSDFRPEAAEVVAGMDDQALAGAVVIGSYEGTDVAAGVRMVEDSALAGAIVMAYNLPENPTPEDVRTVTGALADASADRSWPVFLGVDQEGGPVSRLGTAALDMPPLMVHGAADDPEITTGAIQAQGVDLRDLGFTADFAPSADVTIGARDAAINVRSAGDDPDLVSRTVTAAISGYTDAGILSSAKHFPGHGSLTDDSHDTLPVSDRSVDEMADRDIAPFRAAVDAGVPMVMMGHIGLPGAEDTPATLNPHAYSELREVLGHDGVVVTDAMNMGAVPSDGAGGESVAAIAAGADLVLLPPDAETSADALRSALDSGELDRERLVEAAERVVAMQLWQEHASELAVTVDDPAERVDALADAALTVVAGECRIAEPVDAVAVVGGDRAAISDFTAIAEENGLAIDAGADTTVALSESAAADVVYGTQGPWRLTGSAAATVLAGYDDYAAGLGALARYLTGEIAAGGSLPVELDGVDAPDCG